VTAKIDARSASGMTTYVIEGTEEEVKQAIERVERRYHPLGYGTSFMPLKPKGDGVFVTTGSHSNSCD